MADTTDQSGFEEQGPRKGIVIIVISILLGTNALLLWQFFEKAKAELARLKEMNVVYLAQIDSLNTVNTQLKAENTTLNSNLNAEQSKNQNLSSENSKLANKVAAGSILKAFNVVAEGLRYKSN